MSNVPGDLKYSKEHEWVRFDGKKAYIGITDFAQSELGDIVFVELPEVGAEIRVGDTFGTVESVKTVSDLYAPVTGTVVEVNEGLADAPERVNDDPFDTGWMIAVLVTNDNASDLLTGEQYKEHIND